MLGLTVLSLLLVKTLSDNFDPIILVHGFASSADTWEYVDELRDSGLEVFAVGVNPFASNYDRAVEAFAQIKGVAADYGKCASELFDGKQQFSGVDFTGQGFFPQWNADNKVHLVGHSMGGQTIRALERLLREGSGCAEDTSELFAGGNDWITSITSLATPHDGTSILEAARGAEVFIFETLLQFLGDEDGSLDFPQYGLVQGDTETLSDFADRIVDSGIVGTEDFCIFDLSIDGAVQFNSLGVEAYPDTYYLSFAAERTDPEEQCSGGNCETIQVAASGMSFILRIPANIIGSQDPEADRANDGAVNQNRARCPNGANGLNDNCPERDVSDSGFTWTIGEYNVGLLDSFDHFQLTDRDTFRDIFSFSDSGRKLYLDLGAKLQGLDSTSNKNLVSAEEQFRINNAAGKLKMKMRGYMNLQNLAPEQVEVEPVVETSNNNNNNNSSSNLAAGVVGTFVGVGVSALAVGTVLYMKKREAQNVVTVSGAPPQV